MTLNFARGIVKTNVINVIQRRRRNMKKICMIGNRVHTRQNIIPSMRELNIDIDLIASEYLDNQKEFDGIKCYSDYKEMLKKRTA